MKIVVFIIFSLFINNLFAQCGPGETQFSGPTATNVLYSTPGAFDVDVIPTTSTIPAGSTITLENLFWYDENPTCDMEVTISTQPGNQLILRFGYLGNFVGNIVTSGTYASPSLTFVNTFDLTGIKFTLFEPTGCDDQGTSEFQLTINGGICAVIPNPCAPCTPSGLGANWTWTGCKNTDWFDACNWDRLSVPTVSSSVIIPNVTNDPTISGATANCLDITIHNGAIVNLNSTSSGVLNVLKP